jgi:hypothetical protein
MDGQPSCSNYWKTFNHLILKQLSDGGYETHSREYIEGGEIKQAEMTGTLEHCLVRGDWSLEEILSHVSEMIQQNITFIKTVL